MDIRVVVVITIGKEVERIYEKTRSLHLCGVHANDSHCFDSWFHYYSWR